MEYSRLFIFIEGDDDERFFKAIMKPRLESLKREVILWKYAKEPKKRVSNLLNSISAMNADYIFVSDMDLATCIGMRKEKIQNKHRTIDIQKILIVIEEIESWYLAGLNTAGLKNLRIPFRGNTDKLTKEEFENLRPKKFDSRVDFMQEVLKNFRFDVAKQQNRSFRYFMEKFG